MTLVNMVLLFCIVTISIVLYLLKRNDETYYFRNKILDLCYKRDLRMLKQFVAIQIHSHERFYDNLPSYKSMLFSFKPLKLESYFTEEEIKELTEK